MAAKHFFFLLLDNADTGGDVIFRSSDNVHFYIHRKHLEFSTDGFPAGDNLITTSVTDKSQFVPLTETASTLDLLFQFTSPETPPDIGDVDFEDVLALAEAAEKYIVHSAIRICVMRLRDFVDDEHAEEIFSFGSRYNHVSLIFAITPLFVVKPLSEMAFVMPPDLYIPWSMYREQWLKVKVLLRCPLDSLGTDPEKLKWRQRIIQAVNKIGKDPLLIYHIPDSILVADLRKEETKINKYNSDMYERLFRWRDKLVAEVERMRSLKSFVEEYRSKKGTNNER
ncbi:hypothetical protein D9758_016492 [Tetrapyrgos nigripes]|uniref:BTB domain-containing protein n=1 Tax=Tetrapyrgos nigripes TaxID=182062 RepID=A0A8H5CKB6_9AGAR|nr:hypothetical protein D9758_016492 [Tetrapyrgos nigripes]